jgi:hypothetical protein
MYHQHSLRVSATALLAFSFATTAAERAHAQHADIFIGITAGRLTTINDVSLAESHVFEADLGAVGIPGYGDDPGYNSNVLAPNELIGYNVVDHLYYWDGVAWGPPPADERLEITLGGVTQTTVTAATGFQSGPNFAQADGGGAIHTHLGYFVKHPSWNPGDPFNNPIAVGGYALLLALRSSVHEASDPFVIVLNHEMDEETFDAGVDAAADLLPPGCPGDATGDRQVDNQDLQAILDAWGASSSDPRYDPGADLNGDGTVENSDLQELLDNWATDCD